eukprot:1587965-Prymnesium_polylepis.1
MTGGQLVASTIELREKLTPTLGVLGQVAVTEFLIPQFMLPLCLARPARRLRGRVDDYIGAVSITLVEAQMYGCDCGQPCKCT